MTKRDDQKEIDQTVAQLTKLVAKAGKEKLNADDCFSLLLGVVFLRRLALEGLR